jgi:hypothetical protein
MALATVEKKLSDVDKALALRNNLMELLPTLSVSFSLCLSSFYDCNNLALVSQVMNTDCGNQILTFMHLGFAIYQFLLTVGHKWVGGLFLNCRFLPMFFPKRHCFGR